MRTIEEIQAQIVKHEGTAREYDQADYVHDCDVADNMGMIAGFNAGLRQIERGQNSLDIARGAWVDAAAYRSCGNDDEDSYQIGFTRALYWVSEQFDWTEDGDAIFRPGNILGEQSS